MKYSLFLVLLVFSLSAYSQDTYKNVDVKSDYTTLGYKLFSKSPLTKDNTYKESFPSRLQYSAASQVENLVNPFLSLEAKRVKADQPATVTFKYVTNGIASINDDGAYSTVMPGTRPPVKLYYKRLSYSCPFKVEIYDQQGQLAKTLVIANDSKPSYLSIDRNFLSPPPSMGQVPPAPFASSDEANNFYSTNKQKIGEKLESLCLNALKDEVRKAVYSMYDFSKLQRMVIWYFQIEKKSQPVYPDLFEKTEQFKDLLKDVDDPAKKELATKGLLDQYNAYTQQLQSGQQLPEDVKQLCRYNGAVAALFINKLEESKRLYTDFYNKFYLKVPFGIGLLPDNFLTLYKYYYIYNQIQNNLSAVAIDLSQGVDDVHYNRFLKDNNLTDSRMAEAKKIANPENTGYDEHRNKQVLQATWLSYACWTTGNTEYLEPAAYIFKTDTKEVSGQKFLSASGPQKYFTIALAGTTGNIQKAVFSTNNGNFNVGYTWEYNRLTGIKIDGLSGYDYELVYNESQPEPIGVKARSLINNDIQVVVKAQLDGGKITKTTKWENRQGIKEEWIRAIKDINYTDTGTVVFSRTYFTGKPNIEKNSTTGTAVYKRTNGQSYIISQPWGTTTENSYDANDNILKSIETTKNGINEHEYFYNGKQLYKESSMRKNRPVQPG